MIRSSIATRLCTLAAIAASVAGFTAFDASAQGKASMNGQTCSYSDITIKPNGDLSIVCDNGGTPTAPVCTLSLPNTAMTNQSFSISASCNPAATSLNWTSNSGVNLPTGSSGSVSIGAAGTYTFGVSGTNSVGTGAVASKTVTVQAAAPVTDRPQCSSFSASPSSVPIGTATTLSLVCNQSPTVYAWAMYSGPAGGNMSGFSNQTSSGTQTVTFDKEGTYNFAGQAGNAMGGSDMAGLAVTVTRPNSGCSVPSNAVPPTLGYDTLGNLRFDLKPGQTGYQEFDFPFPGFGAARLTIVGATKIETPASTIAEIAVAPCPGMFDVPAGCKAEVYGSTGANFYIGDIAWSSCPVSGGKHYVNIRHNVCNPNSGFPGCTHYIKINGQ